MNSYTTNKPATVAAYAWLRWPSVLLGIVGIWGILNAKLKVIAEFSGSFRLPPLMHCYVITGLAAVLFCISIFWRQIKHTRTVDTYAPHQWRGR